MTSHRPSHDQNMTFFVMIWSTWHQVDIILIFSSANDSLSTATRKMESSDNNREVVVATHKQAVFGVFKHSRSDLNTITNTWSTVVLFLVISDSFKRWSQSKCEKNNRLWLINFGLKLKSYTLKFHCRHRLMRSKLVFPRQRS